jgi:hypothetical protein
MKTLLTTLALIIAATTAVFAGGNAKKTGLNQHNQTVWDNNTVVFAYPAGPGATYMWQQEEGPVAANLKGANTPTLLASSLEPGTYVFALTTLGTDGTTNTDKVVVKVKDPASVTKF